MKARFWRAASAAALLLAQPLIAAAAVAPQYRWESSPDYIAPQSPKDKIGLQLDRYSIVLDCEAVCDITTVLALVSDRPQTKTLTFLVGDPRSVRIELAHHPIVPGAPRRPGGADLEGIDRSSTPPPEYASYAALDLELPLVAGPNELVVKQKLPMSIRGRNTAQVVRAFELNFWPLRGWTRGDNFAVYLNFAFGPAVVTQADGLKDAEVEPLCTISLYDYNNIEVPMVGYRDDQTGRARYPMLYRFLLPARLYCRVGGNAGLKVDAPSNELLDR